MGRKPKGLANLDSKEVVEAERLLIRNSAIHLDRIYSLIERYQFRDPKKSSDEVKSIYIVWLMKRQKPYGKGSIRNKFIQRINDGCSSLLDDLGKADLRMMRVMEMNSLLGPNKFTIPQLVKDLSQLRENTNLLMSEESDIFDRISTKKDGRDYLVRELYKSFVRWTGKSQKYTRETDTSERHGTRSGEFFNFLRDFYEAVEDARSDASIEKDIQLYTD